MMGLIGYRAGGLMQLVAYGAQDVYLSEYRNHNPNNPNNHNGGMIYRPHVKKASKAKKQRVKCFKKFKNFRKNDTYDQHTCCICLDRHKADEFVTVRYCGHIYHQQCNRAEMITCPVCRRE